MKIAITGCAGILGRRVVARALDQGHEVLGIDINEPDAAHVGHSSFHFLPVDLRNYEAVLEAIKGYQGIIHLAGLLHDYDVAVHNSNVVMSWNVLRAAAELGILRIAQASSINVIPLLWSDEPKIDYFPIDENHPCLPDEPYGLSKVICELQADTIVRRYPSTRIASLRPHWVVTGRSHCIARNPFQRTRKDCWGYVQQDSAADAFLLALTEESGQWSGHEAFFIVAPRPWCEGSFKHLSETYFSQVPIKEGYRGSRGFFDCRKAERLIGWLHQDYQP